MNDRPDRTARNVVGGFLVGYGIVAFACFFYLVQHWAATAPRAPDVAGGFVFRHNEHGAISYFSAFQGTSCALLFFTSIPIALVGGAILAAGGGFRRAAYAKADPGGVAKWGGLAGAVAAPALIFLLGPIVVGWLNAAGIVMGF